MLTDQYQLSMAYSYFRAGQHMKRATFEMFFRKTPFGGSYAVFAGLDGLMEYLVHFHFTDVEIDYLRKAMPYASEDYFEYLRSLDFTQLDVRAPEEGTLVFANEPLVIVSGPLGMCQLIETTLLVLVNFATLVCTNACRMRVASGALFTTPLAVLKQQKKDLTELIQKELSRTTLMEFGLRRAQGPNGALSASRYALLGGFNSTSNVLCAKTLGISAAGTMAHAYILSFTQTLEELLEDDHYAGLHATFLRKDVTFADFGKRALRWRERLCDKNHAI